MADKAKKVEEQKARVDEKAKKVIKKATEEADRANDKAEQVEEKSKKLIEEGEKKKGFIMSMVSKLWKFISSIWLKIKNFFIGVWRKVTGLFNKKKQIAKKLDDLEGKRSQILEKGKELGAGEAGAVLAKSQSTLKTAREAKVQQIDKLIERLKAQDKAISDVIDRMIKQLNEPPEELIRALKVTQSKIRRLLKEYSQVAKSLHR